MAAKEAISTSRWILLGPGDSGLVPERPTHPHLRGRALRRRRPFRSARGGRGLLLRPPTAVRGHRPRPRLVLSWFPHIRRRPWSTSTSSSSWSTSPLSSPRNVMVVHDLAYADLVVRRRARSPVPFMPVPGAHNIGVEFFSMSKSYSMPGSRIVILRGQRADGRRSHEAEVVPRLRRLPTDPDRRDHRSKRMRPRPQGDPPRDLWHPRARFMRRVGTDRLGHGQAPRPTCTRGRPIPEEFKYNGLAGIRQVHDPRGPWGDDARHRFRDQKATSTFRYALVENEQRIRQAVRGMKRALRA